MRWMIMSAGLMAVALLGGCGTTPQSWGITGPGQRTQPELAPDDTTVRPPGVPDPNTGVGSEQRFYNYN